MSCTETNVITRPSQKEVLTPDLSNLRTVRWIVSTEVIQEGQKILSVKYKAAKEIIPFLSLYLTVVEMILSAMYLFAHSLPYPQFVLGFVNRVDCFAEGSLDSLANRLEWKSREVMITDEQKEEVRSLSTVSEVPLIQCDLADYNRYISGSTSGSESEVSVVSESWIMGHTDKYGKSYNRLEMRANAEGRLRAAMYRRISGQLKIMRQNSFSFSKGMTEYTRQILQPKVLPIYEAFKVMYGELAKKHGFKEQLEELSRWLEKHYIIAAPINLTIKVATIIVNAFIDFVIPKKKLKKTRSMRSESLKRRAAAAAVNPAYPKPDYQEVPDREEDALAQIRMSLFKGHNIPKSNDSAIASSIDDYHTSDSTNDSYKPQTIYKDVGNEPQSDKKQGNDRGINEPKDIDNSSCKEQTTKKIKRHVSYDDSTSTTQSTSDTTDSEESTTKPKHCLKYDNQDETKSTLKQSKRESNEEKEMKRLRRISFTLT